MAVSHPIPIPILATNRETPSSQTHHARGVRISKLPNAAVETTKCRNLRSEALALSCEIATTIADGPAIHPQFIQSNPHPAIPPFAAVVHVGNACRTQPHKPEHVCVDERVSTVE
ncbi:hypothetical protein P280DRAFT_192891 [Massarina eburnea CBS 473.64]|uniref:Uncharacterized protein n=1 Tax=Massarina eburnea CBS 473.64 TaxID=1395130 RepID=A0A6A6RK43_9PLEO|nr:hypothetical protein P280DRAFT_192891 [Massarina eburnea CBS 473.64]